MFGRKKPDQAPTAYIQPMRRSDIPRILDIIAETDEDDAEDAQEDFQSSDLNGMYVLCVDGNVVGVVGYSPSEAGDEVVWLSYTYIDPAYHRNGHGRLMMTKFLELLHGQDVRKIFIATSDYVEDGEAIYAAAHAFYQSFGAEREVVIPDFHGRDEARIIYGLENPGMPSKESMPSDPMGVQITGFGFDDEAEDVALLEWTEGNNGLEGFPEMVAAAAAEGARMVVLALPSDMAAKASNDIVVSGFETAGELKDYYAPGLGQVWWFKTLK